MERGIWIFMSEGIVRNYLGQGRDWKGPPFSFPAIAKIKADGGGAEPGMM